MLRRRRPAPAVATESATKADPAREPDDTARVRVHVADEDSGETLDLEAWGAFAGTMLEAEGVRGPGEASLLFVNAEAMALLNKIHMGHDGPTDVLSFPIDGDDHLIGVEERLVGDIVVCPSVARANAAAHAGTFENEVALLITHGILHLLGHDHAEPDERARMWEREQALLTEFWGELPADAWTRDE